MNFFLEDGTFINTDEPLDISLPLRAGNDNPRAWYVAPPRMEPVRENGFLGSVSEGGNVNFRDIYFNPHGHGTHTECLGHITPIVHSVNKTLSSYFFNAALVSIEPTIIQLSDGSFDKVISKQQMELALKEYNTVEAVILRTLPNGEDKKFMNYSATNPPYLEADVVEILDAYKVKHFLVDLPSVDRESDGGKLEFHHCFWSVPGREDCTRTITELIFVSDEITDGSYVLEMQLAPFENDASPSRPVLYQKHIK